MEILVTNGAGFIGSNFVRYLLNETSYRATTLDSLTYAGLTANLPDLLAHERHEFVEGDIRDTGIVDDLVAEEDAIVNFAAESHVDRSIKSASNFVQTNVKGTQVLLDAARRHDIERFIQVSTDEVYGEIENGQFHEGDKLEPRNPYAATKASADLLAQSYYVTHGVPVIITRSSNNYGPRQHHEKLIPKFLTRADAGKSLPLYGDGSNIREWTYVEDNCRALALPLDMGDSGEVYNIGSGDELTNQEVTERILELVGG